MVEENWIEVGKVDSIDMEDLIRFDHAEKTFAALLHFQFLKHLPLKIRFDL